MTTKRFFRAPWWAAFLMSLFCIGCSLFSCRSDEDALTPSEQEAKPLVTFYVHDNQPWLFQGDKGFVFASDENGNVLVTQEIHAGDTVKLFLEEGQSVESFTLTEIYIKGSTSSYYAYSYTDLVPGCLWFATRPFGTFPEDASPYGNVTVNLIEEWPYNASIVTAGVGYPFSTSNTVVSPPLSSSPGLLYVRTDPPNARFALYKDIVPGQTIDVDVAGLNRTFVTETVDVPEGLQNVNIGLFGYTKSDDYRWPYFLGAGLVNQTNPLLYPNISEFTQFGSRTTFDIGLANYVNYNKKAKYDLTVLDPEFSVASNAGSRITFSCSDKEVDRVSLLWHYGQTGSLWQFVTRPGANRKIELPVFPDEVAALIKYELSTDLFRMFVAEFDAYEDTAGYADWLQQVLASKTDQEKIFQGYDRSRKQASLLAR